MTTWTRYSVADPAQGGMPAAQFEHPSDWRPDSRVIWNLQQTQSPVQVFAMAVAPDNVTAFEALPWQAFGSSQNAMGFAAPGQNIAGVIQMQPVAPEAAITQLLIPNWRGRMPNLQVLGTDITQLEAPYDARVPNAVTSAHKLKARIAYDLDGRRIEEIFHATMPVISMPPAGWGMAPMTTWQLTDIVAFRAPSGELDASRATFERIQNSWQFNPQWKAALQQRVGGLLAQASAATNQILANGRAQIDANRRASNEFIQRGQAYVAGQQARVDAMDNPVYTGTSSTYSPFEASSASSSDYTSHNQSIDGIREEQTVHNPDNTANEKISSHYDHVWKDHNGNLQGTNDPNYDPNTGSEFGNWTQATVKRPGGQ